MLINFFFTTIKFPIIKGQSNNTLLGHIHVLRKGTRWRNIELISNLSVSQANRGLEIRNVVMLNNMNNKPHRLPERLRTIANRTIECRRDYVLQWRFIQEITASVLFASLTSEKDRKTAGSPSGRIVGEKTRSNNNGVMYDPLISRLVLYTIVSLPQTTKKG